jgi:hypothetical protein
MTHNLFYRFINSTYYATIVSLLVITAITRLELVLT